MAIGSAASRNFRVALAVSGGSANMVALFWKKNMVALFWKNTWGALSH